MAKIVLRDFQDESIEAMRDQVRAGLKNIVLSAPTGSGKTVCGSYLLDECLTKRKRGIFICDRISLIDQTSAMLDSYDIPHGVIQAQHYRWQPYQKIQIASAATLERRGLPDDLELIVVDECHAMRKDILARIAKRDCITIGLTATPFSKGIANYYDGIINVTTTNLLIAQGFLSPYRVFAPSEPDMRGARLGKDGEWLDQDAADRAMPIVGDCVQEYLRNGEGGKFLAYGCTVDHCAELQRQFMSAGVQCALYTYRTPDEERTQIVSEFRRPSSFYRGLISVSALAKGFDVPDVTTIILARPLRKSLSEHIQMVGRGLRIHPDKKLCNINDHAGNCVRFWADMQDFFENGCNELDDGTRKAKKKAKEKEKEPMKCSQCNFVHAPAPTCPNCGHAYTRRQFLAHTPGELKEIGGSTDASRAEKQVFWSQLRHFTRERGYKPGFALAKFREKFGEWPTGLADSEIEPTEATRKWILSRQIAWSRSTKLPRQAA